MKRSRLIYFLAIAVAISLLPQWNALEKFTVAFAKRVAGMAAPVTPQDGDWAAKTATLTNTSEADLMARTGDIDNLNFGWPGGFDPFSGNSTPIHAFPWSVDASDPSGTDRIMVITSYSGNPPSGSDGYTGTTSRPANNVQSIVLNYSLGGITVTSARLQMFVDDFQASVWKASYQVTLNGVRAQFLEEILNSLDQSGPIGKLISVQIPQSYLSLVASGQLTINIDDKATGAGDGYAIDFVKLLINPKGTAQKGTITGTVTSSVTQQPLAGVTVSAGGIVETQTGSDGKYTLNDVPAGLVAVRASKSGYASKTSFADLISGQTIIVNFTLDLAPVIDITPTSLDFGIVSSGQTKTLDLTVKNIGAGPLVVSTITSDNPVFTVASATSLTVPAGQQQTVTIRFSPTNANPQTGTLTINNNDPNRPAATVPLSGNGGAGCTYTLSPTSQSFPPAGGTGSVSVTAQKPAGLAGAASPEAATSFRQGDVFAAVGQGKVKRFSPDGTLLQTLDSGSGSSETAGMAFDKAGNLYSTQFQGSSVYKFNINGDLIGAFGTGYDSHPESIVIDLNQNIYVGHADGARRVRKFDISGALLDTFNPATESRGTDWIDLAADQKTIFYTSEGTHVKRYDVSTKTQLADFNTTALPGSYAYALRILPGGGVIVADTQTIVRLDANGTSIQSYDAPGQDNWFAVNLDNDGQTFWSGDLTTGKVYRFNIATGNVVTSWDSGKFTTLAGLSVFGEITASQVLRVSKSAPATVAAGSQLTYTISYGNTGTADAANVVIRDTVPSNTTFVSATNGGTFSNGVVTWNLGPLAGGTTGGTVSFTVSVGSGLSTGTVITNNTYTIEATSVPAVQGTPVTTTVTGGGSTSCSWTATSNAPWIIVTSGTPGTDNGTVGYTVAANTTAESRTGTITIAGLTFTVTQAGAGTLGPLIRIEPTTLSFNAIKGQPQIASSTDKEQADGGATRQSQARPKTVQEQLREVEGDHVQERMEWFYRQREFPVDRIPERARERALENREQAREQMRRAGTAETIEALAAQWTHIGPSVTTSGAWGKVSGRVTSIAVHPTNPSIVYVGGAQGGVWRTTDNGNTWIALTDDQPSLAIGALALDPNNPSVIYAGTGEENFSRDSYYGNGVLKSSNGGVTWSVMGAATFARQTIGRIAVSPGNSQVVFAAANSGLYRSPDGGASWTRVLTGVVTDVTAMPGSGSVFYAAVNGSGVFKSTDGGTTWPKLTTGLPTSNFGRVMLAISAGTPNTLLAAFTAGNSQLEGLYRSPDAGATWTKLGNTPNVYGGQGWYNVSLGIHPANTNVIYFGGLSLWRSADGGSSWSNVSNPRDYFLDVHPDQHAFAFNPQNPTVVWLGCDGGVWRSDDAGATWLSRNDGLSLTQFQTVALHPTNDSIAFGGTQDNGIQRFTGTSAWQETRTGDNGSTYFDFNSPATVYSTYILGSMIKSLKSGDPGSWFSSTNGIPFSNGKADTRVDFYAPFAMDPTNPQKLAFGSYRVWYTTDGMANWSAVSGDVTGGGAITAITVGAPGTRIWTGSSDAQVWRGDLSGGTWSFTNVTKSPLPGRSVTRIATHPTDPQIAYISYSGFGNDHIFKTTDGGATWNSAAGGIPDIPVNVVLVDPNSPTAVYAGTDIGVYRSTDQGANWEPFGVGLPNVAVFDLAIRKNSNLLRVATHGRGMWEIQITGEQSFTIFNDGDATLTVTGIAKQNNSAWVSFTVPAVIPFDIPPKGSVPVRVAVNATGLNEGLYTERLLVTSNDTPRSPYPTGVFINLNVTNSGGGGGCTFSISPPSQNFGATGGTGTVNVTATSGCQWTALQVEPWITITSGASGSGNGTVGFSVAANTDAASRTGTIKIAGQTFTVTQSGGSTCSYTLSPTSKSFGSAGGSDSVGVTTQAGCAWNAISNSDWIVITSGASATGNGTTNYFVAANNGTDSRTGTMTIAGQTFTVTQTGNSNCVFTITPTSQFYSSGGGSGSINVATTTGCNWTAVSGADWIQIVSGSRGTGGGTVTYSVAANPSTVPRAANIFVAGQSFIVGQAGTGSTCGLQPISIGQTVTGALATTDCRSPIYGTNYYADLWYFTAKAGQQVGITLNSSNFDAYVTLLSPDGQIYADDDDGGGGFNSRIPPGTGYITLEFDGTYLIEASSAISNELGNYTLSLFAPTGCSFGVAPTNKSFGANGGTDSIAVTTQSGCAWNAVSNTNWIIITSGNTGTDSGTVNYSVAANTSVSSRTGTITVANQTFTVTQSGGSACTFAIVPTSQNFGTSAATGTVGVTTQAGCNWAARSNADWITITSGAAGSGNGTVGFSLTANNGIARTGTITIAGLTFTVNQVASSACTYLLSPTSQSFDSSGGTGNVNVSSPAGCFWQAIPSDSWITVKIGTESGTGNGSVGYSVGVNSGATGRTGTITIGNQVFVINQSSVTGGCPTVSGISPARGPQGSSVLIFGTNLTGTTVKFANNVSATITSTSETSLTVVVPVGAVTGSITISKAGCPDLQTAIFTVTGDGNCVTSPSGVLGWWPGDGTANDLAAAHNGTLKNGAAYAAGFVSQAFQFDGIDDFVDLGGFAPGAQWTLEAWVKPSAVPAGRHAILGGIQSCADWALVMQDGKFGLAIKPASGGCTDTVLSGVTAVAGTWYHLVGTNDGTTARLYVNGELKGTALVSPNYIGTNAGTYIGGDVCCSEFFSGLIDEPTIFSRSLAASEVLSVYSAGSAGKCKTPIVTCPTVSGINPTSGLVGSTVTITGTGFTGVTAVRFANNVTAQFTVTSDTQITATVPAGAVTGAITISKAGCNDLTTPTFTVTTPACPTVSGINPTSGVAGSTVTITGTNFTGVSSVKFANNVTAQFTVNSASQITATVPAGAVTGPITISKAGCSDANTGTFTVTPAGPCIDVVISTSLTGMSGSTLTVPVTASDTTGKGALSYDAIVSFDPSVLRLQSNPVDKAGTLSSAMTLTLNTSTPGQLRISAFNTVPLTGAGTLIYLKFDIISAVGTCSNLTWTSFRFNEGTPCSTVTNGRACVVGGSLAGAINYCITPKPVPGVLVSANGTPSASMTTGADGMFSLMGLGGGAYTLTPAKSGDINGLASFDAALVALHVVGTSTLNSCQQIAGDTSNSGDLSSFDAALIAQYVVGISNPANFAGTWKFVPPSRSYTALTSNQTGQNFDAVLIGDVSGNWVAGAAGSQMPLFRPLNTRIEDTMTTIALPATNGFKGETITVPITVGDMTGKNVIAYDFDLTFDPMALQPAAIAYDATGTMSAAMTITPNATTGRLRISGFGTTPLAGAGTLLKLKFVVLGSNATTAVTWQKAVLNEETMSAASLTNGQVTIPIPFTSISAGAYQGLVVAPESIAAGYGFSLAVGDTLPISLPLPTELAGRSVKVKDSTGTERLAQLFYVGPTQINYLVPAGTALGPALITVISGNSTLAGGVVEIAQVVPVIFTMTQDGFGVPSGFAIRVKPNNDQIRENLWQFEAGTGKPIPAPIDMGPDNEAIVLELYGTGIRKRTSQGAVTATIGGVAAGVEYADVHGYFIGVDQVNVRVPRSLIGRGQVDIVLMVDGKTANVVPINIK